MHGTLCYKLNNEGGDVGGDEGGNEGGDEGGNEGSDDSCFYDV